MSKIKVFVKADGWTPASFMVTGFRMMRPAVPTGKKPISSKWMRYATLCELHDGREPTVPLDTYYYNPETHGAEFIGVRKYCFFCWMPTEKVLKKD